MKHFTVRLPDRPRSDFGQPYWHGLAEHAVEAAVLACAKGPFVPNVQTLRVWDHDLNQCDVTEAERMTHIHSQARANNGRADARKTRRHMLWEWLRGRR